MAKIAFAYLKIDLNFSAFFLFRDSQSTHAEGGWVRKKGGKRNQTEKQRRQTRQDSTFTIIQGWHVATLDVGKPQESKISSRNGVKL